MQRPNPQTLVGKDPAEAPMSLQRIIKATNPAESVWIGPNDALPLSTEDQAAYDAAHKVQCHLCVQAPVKHSSGHPGGPLSAFSACFVLGLRRNPHVDQPLRMSPGHLSLLGFGLQWMFGREGENEHLSSPQAIIDTFRTPDGLPSHIEAGLGDIPFGTGPLGKAVSHGVGTAFGLKLQKKPGLVDVLLADGDSQEGQVAEAFRLAAHLKLDNLIVHGDWNDIQLSSLPSDTVATDFAHMAQAMGWQVIEVQNGNDPSQVNAALKKAEELSGQGHPIFICYYTTMGYGIPLMEEGSNTGEKNYHGAPLKPDVAEEVLKDLPPLDSLVAEYEPFRVKQKKLYESEKPTETNIGLDWKAAHNRTVMTEKGAARKEIGALHIRSLMANDERIVVLHADLAGSGGFDKVEQEFPDRVINVGVAEANMYMMAAGMRQTGLLPVTYTFAAFATHEARANARLIDINCGHTRCGVFHNSTHAGLSVGEDGETHQERNYLNLPYDNTQVWMPADSNQAGAMVEKAFEVIAEGTESVYLFSGRSGHEQLLQDNGKPFYGKDYQFTGHADTLHGEDNVKDQLTIVATGSAVHDALAAAKALKDLERPIQARVLNVASIRPIDASAIIKAALETTHLLVVEDHHSEGGLATQIADIIADFGLPCSLRRLGANTYFPSAKADDLKIMAGIDVDSIIDAAQDEVVTEVCGGEDVFVSCVHNLPKSLVLSRFGGYAEEYVEQLQDKKYLDTLRAYYQLRACPTEKLPSNDALQKHLKQASDFGDLL